MADILFKVILPMGLAGTLFYALLCLLRPLAGKMKPGHTRATLLLAATLLVVPLHLPVLAQAPAPAAQAPGLAQAGGALGNTLRTAAPTAPVYQAGQAVAQALEQPEAGAAAAPGRCPPWPGLRFWSIWPGRGCSWRWRAPATCGCCARW